MYERNRLLYAGDACQGSAVLPFGQPRTSLGNAETGTFFVARLSGQPVSVSMPPRGHEATALVDGADWQRLGRAGDCALAYAGAGSRVGGLAAAVAGCSAGGRNSAWSAISGKFGAACGWSRGRENGIRPVSRLWQEDFLRLVSADLNGLYLVGQKEAAWEHFSDWLYEESGLPVCFVNRIPETDGRKTVLVELRANARILKEHPEFGSLYVDLTSDVEKRRQIREKRADISYISARNYLDTALKARYNAI